MKQFFTTITCALLAALASCSNDHVLYDYTKTDNTPIEIATSIGGVDVLTKAATDVYGGESSKHFDKGTEVNVYIFEHVEGEQTRVYTYGDNGKVVYTAEENGVLKASPTNYFPGNGHGIDIYGIYPNSIVASTQQQTFSVNTNQSDDANYKASDLMFAAKQLVTERKTTPTLTFKHQLSKVIVILEKGHGLNETDLNDAEVKILNTKPSCTIESVGENEMKNIAASGDTDPITVGRWNNETTSSGLAAIVVPQKIADGTALIQVTLRNNVIYTYKYTTKSGENQFTGFTSGNQHTFTLTLSTSGITVNAEISGWVEGTGVNGEATLK